MFPLHSRDLWYNGPDLLQIDFISFLHPLLPATTHKVDKQKIVLFMEKKVMTCYLFMLSA